MDDLLGAILAIVASLLKLVVEFVLSIVNVVASAVELAIDWWFDRRSGDR